jgi:uncharacterized protein YegL
MRRRGNVIRLIRVGIVLLVLTSLMPRQVVSAATPKFLTLPFSDPGVKLQQGFEYTFSSPNQHGGIDFVKGTIDDSDTWQTFDVRAAVDGDATYTTWPPATSGSERYGNFVTIKHTIGGTVYYTLYAHLASSSLEAGKTTPVARGAIIGRAGQTGSGSNGYLHLHFEFSQTSWGAGYKRDPYDLDGTQSNYPQPGSSVTGRMGPDHYWVNDPPRYPFSGSGASRMSVALIIDSSGSMLNNDPSGLRKAAGKLFIDLAQAGDKIAVVDFDSSATVRAVLTQINSATEREGLKSAVNLIDSNGLTNIGAGLQSGYNLLNSDGSNNKKAAILLTDGVDEPEGTYQNQHLQFKSKGWAVFTVGLGSGVDSAFLQRVASETDGAYYPAASSQNLQDIYKTLSTQVQDQLPVSTQSVTLFPNQLASLTTSVPPSSALATFSTTWPGSDVGMTLRSPSGATIQGTTPGIYYAKGATYEVIRVNQPEAGQWTVQLRAISVASSGEPVTLAVDAQRATPPPADVSTSLTITRRFDNVLAYTIRATNNGPGVATSVLMVNAITTDFMGMMSYDNGQVPCRFGADAGLNGSFTRVFSCEIGTLAPGASRVFSADLQGPVSPQFTVSARTSANEPDAVTANDAESMTVTMLTCTPRPRVGVTVASSGPTLLRATFTAGAGDIASLTFADGNQRPSVPVNAIRIDTPSGPLPLPQSYVYQPPAGTRQVTVTIQKTAERAPLQVPVVVVDACGAWRTFVGSGSGVP